MLSSNLTIKSWKLVRKIGSGAFGQIFSARNTTTNEKVAVKFEDHDTDKPTLYVEVSILKKLRDATYIPQYISCGRHCEYNYLVMELLGDNLNVLKKKQRGEIFSIATTVKLGIEFLLILQQFHDVGYIHRDIKPSNFVIGVRNAAKIYLIDFGLSRKHLDDDGNVLPPKGTAGFRGTAKYASINSHMHKDLSRRDDLWSLLYVLIEFIKGDLPWKKLKNKDDVRDMKIRLCGSELVHGLPEQFLNILEYIKGLKYADRPDYEHLIELLDEILKDINDADAPYEWITTENRDSLLYIPNVGEYVPELELDNLLSNSSSIKATSVKGEICNFSDDTKEEIDFKQNKCKCNIL